MAFKHGKNTRVWFNDMDLSGFLNSAGLSVSRDPSETTTFASGGWKEYISGLLEASLSFEGNYDPDEDRYMGDALEAEGGVLTLCPGGAASVGDLARLVPVLATSYTESSPIGDKVAVSWEVMSAEAMQFGYVLHPLGEDTNTTTGATRDDGAATETGWTAHLHCTGLDDGSWVINLQDSANGSDWDDVDGGEFDALTDAGYQRLQSVDSDVELRRYVRYVATRSGGTTGDGITFALAIARTR